MAWFMGVLVNTVTFLQVVDCIQGRRIRGGMTLDRINLTNLANLRFLDIQNCNLHGNGRPVPR